MGRPYSEELSLLGATYSYTLEITVNQLIEAINELRARPLVVVGSGGSVSSCHFAARLHETHARLPARVLTPLEFIQHPIPQSSGVLLLSAGGSNPDILSAATHAIRTEYAPVVGLCAREGTPLRTQLAKHRYASVFEYAGPSAKDGFLATNSLVLTCALLARAYGVSLPNELPALTTKKNEYEQTLVEALCHPSIIALAGSWAMAAAMDMESKWSESGFGSVSITDARNFAHGRHYGLSRRMSDTFMLGLATAESLAPVEDTLRRLPSSVETAILQSPLEAEPGALDLLIQIIQITGAVGHRLKLDPGRPRVPAFGRALYHAGITQRVLRREHTGKTNAPEDLWVRRKVTHAVWEGASIKTRTEWRENCQTWVKTAEASPIGAVVFDYDGTLCEVDERYGTPAAAIGAAVTKLVDNGMIIGIATGRGDSVLTAMKAVIPERVWPCVFVGMYNGGVLCRLHERLSIPNEVSAEVARAQAILTASPVLSQVASFRIRPTQLTVRAMQPLPDGLLYRFVLETLKAAPSTPAVDIFTSGHTVDVIVRDASKLRVVDAVRRALPRDRSTEFAVMTIGDQGQNGGNDEAFLAHHLGLSVEHASSVFDGCWNVAPAGARRTAALLGYLESLRPVASGGFQWSATKASRSRRPQSAALAVSHSSPGAANALTSPIDGAGEKA